MCSPSGYPRFVAGVPTPRRPFPSRPAQQGEREENAVRGIVHREDFQIRRPFGKAARRVSAARVSLRESISARSAAPRPAGTK
jgi:hypothetical protein